MIVQAQCGKPLVIGIGGEQQVTAVTFDISGWIAEYGSGSAQLLHRRARDTVATPVAVTQSGGTITWTITESDTAYPGTGEAQLIFIPTGKTKKSAVFTTLVDRALNSPYNVPEPMEGWVDQVTETAAAAELWATGGTQGTPTGTNNAKYYAEQAGSEREAAQTAQSLAENAAAAAARSAANAGLSQISADGSASAAARSASSASDWNTLAHAWANGGGQPITPGANNNAKYYAEQAGSEREAAQTAQGKAEDAQEAAETAQGLAETAQGLAEAAQTAAETAEDNAALWATGGTTGTPGAENNAKYYAEQAAAAAATFETDPSLETFGKAADANAVGGVLEVDQVQAPLASSKWKNYGVKITDGTRGSNSSTSRISTLASTLSSAPFDTASGVGTNIHRAEIAKDTDPESAAYGEYLDYQFYAYGYDDTKTDSASFLGGWYSGSFHKGGTSTMEGHGVQALDLDDLFRAGATRVVLTMLHYTDTTAAISTSDSQYITFTGLTSVIDTLKENIVDDEKLVFYGETEATLPEGLWKNYGVPIATGKRGTEWASNRLSTICSADENAPFNTRSGIKTNVHTAEIAKDTDPDSATYGEYLDFQFYAYAYDDRKTGSSRYLGAYWGGTFHKSGSVSGHAQQYLDLQELWDRGATRAVLTLLHCTDTDKSVYESDSQYLTFTKTDTVFDETRDDILEIREKRSGLNAVNIGSPSLCICTTPDPFDDFNPAKNRDTSVDYDIYDVVGTLIYPEWDALCTAYPNWIQRQDDLGYSSCAAKTVDGETRFDEPIPIRHYILKNMHAMLFRTSQVHSDHGVPQDEIDQYNRADRYYHLRRIMISGGVHGGERAGVWGPLNFVKELLSSNENWAQFIKANCILDIVPVLNPWGYNFGPFDTVDRFDPTKTNKYPGRYNANDEDLNRDYLDRTQPETQAYCNYLDSLNGDIWASFDCHTTHIYPGGDNMRWGYVNISGGNPAIGTVMRMANEMMAACGDSWEPIVTAYPPNGSAPNTYVTSSLWPYMIGGTSDNTGINPDYFVVNKVTNYAVTVETAEFRDSTTEGKTNQGPMSKQIMDTLGNMIQAFLSLPFRDGLE